jgi:hypothetical protein
MAVQVGVPGAGVREAAPGNSSTRTQNGLFCTRQMPNVGWTVAAPNGGYFAACLSTAISQSGVAAISLARHHSGRSLRPAPGRKPRPATCGTDHPSHPWHLNSRATGYLTWPEPVQGVPSRRPAASNDPCRRARFPAGQPQGKGAAQVSRQSPTVCRRSRRRKIPRSPVASADSRPGDSAGHFRGSQNRYITLIKFKEVFDR